MTVDDGNPCCDPASQQAQWRRHFTAVLNICSRFDPQELNLVEQRSVFEKIAAIPSNNDAAAAALAKLRIGRLLVAQGFYLRWLKWG